jgi:AAA family ATP:ADP antiporter
MTRGEKLFIFFAMLCGMTIAGEYAIIRPASTSLFITYFSAAALPWVWLATVPLNLFVIYLYNKFLPKIGPLRMIRGLILFTIAVHLLCASLLSYYPQLIFLQFAWKDIYILLMFKQLWSLIHNTIQASRAKFWYGLIFGMGTVGSILGSLLPGFFAVEIGSERLFFLTAPLYLFLLFCYRMAFYRSNINEDSLSQALIGEKTSKGGFSLIRKSPFLVGLLLLVVFMQVSAGLIEYLLNTHLEVNIPDQDLRTEYCGRLVGITNILSGVFQIAGGFLIIHTLGVQKSHFLIPFVLCLSALFSWINPTFAAISFSFVFLKSIDFSLFGVLREMLYIPLKMDEKFRAKAIIDVFAYRTSKALVSLCILGLQALTGAALLSYINAFSILVFIAWMGLIVFMFKKHAPYPVFK